MPPRLPSSAEDTHVLQINEEVKNLNSLLKELSDNECNIWFVNNDEVLLDNGKICETMYNTSDKTGVHFNENGQNTVANVFLEAMRNCFEVQE